MLINGTKHAQRTNVDKPVAGVTNSFNPERLDIHVAPGFEPPVDTCVVIATVDFSSILRDAIDVEVEDISLSILYVKHH